MNSFNLRIDIMQALITGGTGSINMTTGGYTYHPEVSMVKEGYLRPGNAGKEPHYPTQNGVKWMRKMEAAGFISGIIPSPHIPGTSGPTPPPPTPTCTHCGCPCPCGCQMSTCAEQQTPKVHKASVVFYGGSESA